MRYQLLYGCQGRKISTGFRGICIYWDMRIPNPYSSLIVSIRALPLMKDQKQICEDIDNTIESIGEAPNKAILNARRGGSDFSDQLDLEFLVSL